jgi:hypothetical protein
MKTVFKNLILLCMFLFIGSACEPPEEDNVFIVIHMEPGSKPKTTENPEMYWEDLIELVSTADSYELKLNLLFNPQWATHIIQNASRLATLREWEAKGHLVGLHHHGPHHLHWNGYTNQSGYTQDEKDIGTIEEMMALMNQLLASGRITTGCISTDEDKDGDWPVGIIYSADGGVNGVDDLISTPETITYNGQQATTLTNGMYATGHPKDVTLVDSVNALDTAGAGEFVGIAFHVDNFAVSSEKFVELFEVLASK